LTSCGQWAISAEALCELEKELPTVSEKDTDQTIIEVANFNSKFRSGCNIEVDKKESP